jgi:hypothetical protein
MITETGKSILGKYLIGQAPAYASYIAIGCGAKPLNTDAAFIDYSAKNIMDFEMFRVPIVSRGYITENGISKIVLTAELPTEERYEISEVGIFSAGANPSAGAYDSKTIFAFTTDENWEYHITAPEEDAGSYELVVKYSPLDDDDQDNIINDFDQTVGNKTFLAKAFQTNSDNRIFTNSNRISRYERCRFFNNAVVLRGDTSDLSVSGGHIVVNSGSQHIHLTGASLDFNKNAPTDEVKIAFSVINRDGQAADVPDGVRLMIEAASTDIHDAGEWARFEIDITNGTASGEHDFASNRYVVATKQFQELYKSSGFTWSGVDVVKIYATVIKDGVPSEDFYVCFDAIRVENISTINPLYGMTGYTVLKNTNAETIVKAANTTNYIEFRFAMDVV